MKYAIVIIRIASIIIDNNFDKNTFFLTHPNYQTNKDGSFSMWIRPLEFMELDENIKNNRLALLNTLKNKYIILTDFSKL